MNKTAGVSQDAQPVLTELNQRLENLVADFSNINDQMKGALNRIGGYFPPTPVNPSPSEKPQESCATERLSNLLGSLAHHEGVAREILATLNRLA